MAAQGTILIVEDEPGPALALKMILKPYYHVYSAERGEAALEILKTAPIDVVSLDLRMPGLSGMPLLAKIKAHDPDIEVIVLTAATREALMRTHARYFKTVGKLTETFLDALPAKQQDSTGTRKTKRRG